MQVRQYLYLKIRIFLVLALFCLSLINCKADEMWGLPLDETKTRIRCADFSFISRLDLNDKQILELFKLGPGAPYYFYFIFRDMGIHDSTKQMLKLQWDRGRGVWREEAGLLILDNLLKTREYGELERLGEEFLFRIKNPARRLKCKRLILEALYWQKKDKEVLKRLEKTGEGEWDCELTLFRAVSSSRLGLPEWQDMFRSLFFSEEISRLQVRALSFLRLEERYKSFREAEFFIFEARVLLYTGKVDKAIVKLEKALPLLKPERLEGSPVIRELGRAYLRSGDLSGGAEYLTGLADTLTQSEKLTALEYAGRLYRKQKDFPKARSLLSQVIRESSDPGQRNRSIWLLLDLMRKNRSQSFLKELARLAGEWENPHYFDDILEEEITHLTAEKRWGDLIKLYQILRNTGSENIRSRLSYLMARLKLLKLLPDTAEAGSVLPEVYLKESVLINPDSYYAWLSGALLTEHINYLPSSVIRKEEERPLSELEQLIWGFFEFGQHMRGYNRLQSNRDLVDNAFILKTARELHNQEYFLESIRLMNLYLSRNSDKRVTSELKLMYPRGYLKDIEDLANREDIPDLLLYALVREESHFNPEITSSAGAVGLTQLMPETASDIARQMRIGEFDLLDARLNLELGFGHLAKLLNRLSDIPKALMAYNAGLNRVRRWEKLFMDLPVDLFVEAIPYRETRHYVRKVLVSAVYYAYLYREQRPEDTVLLFFPELNHQGGDL